MNTPAVASPVSSTTGTELTDLLVEISVAVQRCAMYPGGHPSLATGERRLYDRLTETLSGRTALTIGVARDQLVIDGVTTGVRSHHVRVLADRLHGHRVAGVKFIDGMTADELSAFLNWAARDDLKIGRSEPPTNSSLSLGPHVQLYRLAYERIVLADETSETPAEDRTDAVSRATQLWLQLAQAAISAEESRTDVNTDPVVLARAIDAETSAGRAAETPYEQAVVGYLTQIADELRKTPSSETHALRDRIGKLVTTLSPQAVKRLLNMGGNLAQRRTFLTNANAAMPVDAVLALATAAGDAGQQAISEPLTRLLVKLATHAQHGSPPARATVDLAFRDCIRDLIDRWTLPNPTPGEYGSVLDHMARTADPEMLATGITQVCEPEHVMDLCIELREEPSALWEAIETLIARSDIIVVLRVLDSSDPNNPLVEIIRNRIATRENFRRLLECPDADAKQLEDFARRSGIAAIDVLLDALAAASSRSSRRRLLDALKLLGDDIGEALVERLPGTPWYMQRNLLLLLSGLPALPPGFSPLPYLAHTDSRVRREALRILLKYPDTRVAGLVAALEDEDSQIVRVGLEAAAADCPPAIVAHLIPLIAPRRLPQELTIRAIQLLSALNDPAALDALLRLVIRRTRFFGFERLAPRSPTVAAALAGLAAHWPDDPRVGKVLAKAAQA